MPTHLERCFAAQEVAVCEFHRRTKHCLKTADNSSMLRKNNNILAVTTTNTLNCWTGRRVPKRYSSCYSSCCYQFSKGPKIPKAFLIRSRVQQNFAYTSVLAMPIDLPPQIFQLFSN